MTLNVIELNQGRNVGDTALVAENFPLEGTKILLVTRKALVVEGTNCIETFTTDGVELKRMVACK